MEKNQSLEELHRIRHLMERSSKFISLSGLSGVFAGIFALIGGMIALYTLTNGFNILDYGNRSAYQLDFDRFFFLILLAAIVLVLSISFAVFFTTRKAKKQGLPLWDGKAFRMIAHMAVPLAAGGIFCLTLMYHALKTSDYTFGYQLFALVAPSTLLFYGFALLNASHFTLDEIKWLGVSEIILGLLGCIFTGYGLIFWMLGFGVLHIFYGTMMWYKYERNS